MIFRMCLRTAAIAAALVLTMPSIAQNNQTNPDQATQNRLHLRRASQLWGTQVQTQDNQNAGRITNLAVNPETGDVVFAVIEVQGQSGQYKIAPFEALTFTDSTARLNIDMNRFRNAPPFDPAGWNTKGDPQWARIVFQHYGLSAEKAEAKAVSQGRLVPVTESMKLEVQNHQNQELGQVEDMMIDMRRGRVVYAVLSGVPGVENRLVVVPLQAMNFRENEKVFVLNMDRNQIRNAPSIEPNNWQRLDNTQFVERVAQFYNVDADTILGYVPPDQGNSDDPASGNNQSARGGWQFQSEYDRQFDPNSIVTINGRVTAVETFRPNNSMTEGVRLRVQTNDNQVATVHLGPAWFIEHQTVQLREGDQVRVTGSRVSRGAPDYIMATEVRRGNEVLYLRDQDGKPRWDATFRMGQIRGDDNFDGQRGRSEDRRRDDDRGRGNTNRD